MSVSATTAAKKRRAGNIVSSPLFKPTNAPIENSIQRRTNQNSYTQPNTQPNTQNNNIPLQQTNNIRQTPTQQRPMSLQQVISVFDKRLLTIESRIANDKDLLNENAASVISQPSITKEEVQEMIQNQMNTYASEFDHRYQMLASEIANLKQIVLKLQSYTLDVNKSLIEERIQILSDMKANVVIQPEDTLNLKDDIKELQELNDEDSNENITFSLNNNITQELIEETLEETIHNEEPITEIQPPISSLSPTTVASEAINTNLIEEEKNKCCEEQTCCEEENNCCKEEKDCCEKKTCCDKEDEIIAAVSNENIEQEVIIETVESDEEEIIAEPVENTEQKLIAEPVENTEQELIAEPVENTEQELIAEAVENTEQELISEVVKENETKPKRKRKNKKSVSVNI